MIALPPKRSPCIFFASAKEFWRCFRMRCWISEGEDFFSIYSENKLFPSYEYPSNLSFSNGWILLTSLILKLTKGDNRPSLSYDARTWNRVPSIIKASFPPSHWSQVCQRVWQLPLLPDWTPQGIVDRVASLWLWGKQCKFVECCGGEWSSGSFLTVI